MPSKLGYIFDQVILRFTKKVLGPHVSALLVRSDNGIFAVDPEDRAVGGVLRRQGSYGLAEIETLKKYLTNDSKVLMVGAHIGTLAFPIAKICREIVCFEANPNTYDLLVKNMALNSVANCRTFNIAAGDKEEEIEFLLNRANSGGSKRVPKIKEFKYYYDNPEKIMVKSVGLDRYLKETGFDLIVMDIEGSEYFALKGMQKILSNSKTLAVEFLPHHLKNVAGVSVEQFVSVIAPHFSQMTVPSKSQTVNKNEFVEYLRIMYDRDEGDESIIFEKV